jgi:hypothetical protein
MQTDSMSDVESLLKQLISKDTGATSLKPASSNQCAKEVLLNCLDQVMKIEGFQFCVNFPALVKDGNDGKGKKVVVDDLVTYTTLLKAIEDGHIDSFEKIEYALSRIVLQSKHQLNQLKAHFIARQQTIVQCTQQQLLIYI